MTQCDTIEERSDATFQHGPLSQRIYLMKLATTEPTSLIYELVALAKERGYTKIVAKVADSASPSFLKVGYRIEAQIPRFYNGKETACFLGYYPEETRQDPTDLKRLDIVLALAQEKQEPSFRCPPLEPTLTLRPCTLQDAPEMSLLYKQVFASYPFPIDNPDYIRQTMQTHIQYYAIENNAKLVALSSAEMDQQQQNVEMTDFATLPQWRGKGLAGQLLAFMEIAMRSKGLTTAYTIARAHSHGMNIIFAQQDYQYNGRLINNTHISGQIESMNVWSKSLA